MGLCWGEEASQKVVEGKYDHISLHTYSKIRKKFACTLVHDLHALCLQRPEEGWSP